MSRLDGKFTAAGDAELEIAELLAALESQPGDALQDWRDAIACYLSAGDGWRDALQRLGGAFAGDGAEQRLSRDKEP